MLTRVWLPLRELNFTQAHAVYAVFVVVAGPLMSTYWLLPFKVTAALSVNLKVGRLLVAQVAELISVPDRPYPEASAAADPEPSSSFQ